MADNGLCTTKGWLNSDLLALQKLDHLAFWAGHEGDASFHGRISAQDDGAWLDTARPPSCCDSSRVSGVGVRACAPTAPSSVSPSSDARKDSAVRRVRRYHPGKEGQA